MDMMDMGYKEFDECRKTASPSSSKGIIDYQSLFLDKKIPDGLEKKEIGDIVDCHIQLKVRRIEMANRMEAGKPKKTFSMFFDVMKMGMMDSPKEDKLAKKIAGLKHGEY